MLEKISISEEERETLCNAYLYWKVRFIAFKGGDMRLYDENSRCIYKQNCGKLYNIAARLPEGEVISLTELMNKPCE